MYICLSKKNFMTKFIYKLRGRCIWPKTNLHKINICCQIGTLHFIGRVFIILSKLSLVRIIDFAEHLVQAYNKPPIIHFLLFNLTKGQGRGKPADNSLS